MKKKYIAIAGNIGVGKSTLSKDYVKILTGNLTMNPSQKTPI